MKKNSLNAKVWLYLIGFSIIILIFLWLFQVIFLNSYYEFVKTNDIKNIANTINNNKNKKDFVTTLENLSYDKSVCIELTDKFNNSIYNSSVFNKGCFNEKGTYQYKDLFINSNLEKDSYELVNPRFDNKTLVYATKLSDNLYAFINTSLVPIDDTVSILKNQLIYVSIGVLILSFIIAYFISRKISTPITKINKASRDLANGKYNVVFDTNEDILELKELASTLNYTRDELEKTDALRRDLMANVSHDLKTPLTMIKAYAEMARDLNSNNKVKRNENLTVISEEVDRLNILVNDILLLSKMQSDIENLDLTKFDIVKLIKDIINRYKVLEEKEGYKFIFNCNKSYYVTADKKKLEQVIYNLINNAINYTGNNKDVYISIISAKANLTVNIKDTGKGINESNIKHIWERYYHNDKLHRRNVYGTGLGLSIVKSILEKHKFKYGVISKENKGTTFYFVIPKEKDN